MEHMMMTDWKKNPLILALLLLLVVQIAGAFFVYGLGTEVTRDFEYDDARMESLTISQIDGPRIDSQAAMIDMEAKRVYPAQLFVFLFLAYLALLGYNFGTTFAQATRPQWFWESLYTLSALIGWMILDGETHLWFPLLTIQTGLTVFVLYVGLLERKLRAIP
jgi:hypothetical protein